VTVLELDAIDKQFGGLPALRGVSLRVDEGEILALVGPNGAGKSTLLKAICGIQPPTRGRIRLNGEEITGLRPHAIRRRGVCMVLQSPRVFESMSVIDNVALGAMFGDGRLRMAEADAHRRAAEALVFVGLADRATHEVGALNLHEQRFLELARAVAGRPHLLLLDEVMAGLNETELRASMDIVRTVRDQLGVTVIWVEHVMTAVMSLAERIVVLNFGQVLADGPPHDVMRDPEVAAAYLGEASHFLDGEHDDDPSALSDEWGAGG
jgi:ABC-type branched-subunit amino acid transport system ATPase component